MVSCPATINRLNETENNEIPAMADQRLPRQRRLRHTGQFQRVYARKCSQSDSMLLVYGCENGLRAGRLGLSVTRKVGPAVMRNRWKRAIRETYRRQCSEIPVGFDWVVIPRAPCIPQQADLEASLLALMTRIVARLGE